MIKSTIKVSNAIHRFLIEDMELKHVPSVFDSSQNVISQVEIQQILQRVATKISVIPEAFIIVIEQIIRFRKTIPLTYQNLKNVIIVSLITSCKCIDDKFIIKKSSMICNNHFILEREFCKTIDYKTLVNAEQYIGAYQIYSEQ